MQIDFDTIETKIKTAIDNAYNNDDSQGKRLAKSFRNLVCPLIVLAIKEYHLQLIQEIEKATPKQNEQ